MSSNESDNEYFKDLLNIDIDCLATLSNELTASIIHPLVSSSADALISNITALSDEVRLGDEVLSNEFTNLIIPPAVSSSTDVLLSNIIGESLPDSDISISMQRGKALMSLFKTMFADFHDAGNSSWCDDDDDDCDEFDHYISNDDHFIIIIYCFLGNKKHHLMDQREQILSKFDITIEMLLEYYYRF